MQHFSFTESSWVLERVKKEVAKKALEGVRCMSGFPDSSSFAACRDEGLCGCSWLKVVLFLAPSMAGVEAPRCRESTTRLEGHGGLEIMKGKASFTSLV